MKKLAAAALSFTASLAASCPSLAAGTPLWHAVPPADAVTTWNANAGAAAVAACISPGGDPLYESRMYAMTHIAIHDALNSIDTRYQRYTYDGAAQPHASADAAVAAAARDVLVPVLGLISAPFPANCGQAGQQLVETTYSEALAAIPDGSAKDAGVALGQAAAAAILELRAADHSNTPVRVFDYPQGTQPGEWRFTPDRPFAYRPDWGEVTPFALKDSSQFLPHPPYQLASRRYAGDLNEVKRLGGDGITTPTDRTADQTEIALFWVESSPLAWNRMARTVSASRHLDMWENGRLFGLLNMAMADGYIASWHTKFDVYKFWRPVTAIQLAGTDGNRRTDGDPTWTPLVTTPPMPDHDSGHSVEGGAAAEVMARFFGTDRISFQVCSLTLPDAADRCDGTSTVWRSFRSFSQAADENGLSRILVGFHFRKAVDAGIQHGRRIADRTVSKFLQPVR